MGFKFVKTFLSTAGVNFVGKGIYLILGVIIARNLGASDFGQYSFLMSILAMAIIPSTAGLPQLLVREISYYVVENKFFLLKGLIRWAAFFTVSVSFLVVFFVFFMQLFGYLEFLPYILLILIPIKSLLTKQMAIINGLQKPFLSQLPLNFIFPSIFLAIITIHLLYGKNINLIFILEMQVTALLITLLISSIIFNKVMPCQLKDITPEYKSMTWLSSLLPLSLFIIVSSLNFEIAILILGFFSDEKSVAFFKVAAQGILVISISLQAVNTVCSPKIASYYRLGDDSKTQNLITKSVRLSSICALPVALTYIIFGEELITLVFGSDYIDASKVLYILSFSQIFNVCLGSVGVILNMTGNERYSIRTLIFTSTVTFFLLVILVPIYNEIGAAISLLISMIIWNTIMAYDVYRLTGLKPWLR